MLTRNMSVFIMSLGLMITSFGTSVAYGDDRFGKFIEKQLQSGQGVDGVEFDTPAPQVLDIKGGFIGNWAERQLLKAIDKYTKLVSAGNWPHMPKGYLLRPNERHKDVATMRRILTLTGDYKRSGKYKFNFDKTYYDRRLKQSVLKFQKRHGMNQSGLVGRHMRRALNISPKEKLSLLQVNLRRMQDMRLRVTGRKFVMVNIPAYRLHAIEDNQIAIDSRVIAGRPDRATPILDAQIRAVNLLPVWRVPRSIATRDIIPALQKDPSFFSKGHYAAFKLSDGTPLYETTNWADVTADTVRFEQSFGEHNALGLIRIDMPNSENVYMHDTPLKRLFKRTSRAFSSGCVRVRKIVDLALWLTEKEGWSKARLEQVTQSGIPDTINLSEKVPVHFAYITAWVNMAGDVQFRNDLYRKDIRNSMVGSVQADSDTATQSIAP